MQPGISLDKISFDHLTSPLFTEKEVEVTVVRLDKIHPDVSGNKLFKLHYFLQACAESTHRTMLTFGGAYSNHLVATAYACAANKLSAIGIVRGEKAAVLSHTLERCLSLGMQLHFISKEAYRNSTNNDFVASLNEKHGAFTLIPEGGYSLTGAEGALLIHNITDCLQPTHIATAVGSATTLAGLLLKQNPNQQIIAVPVIKNMHDIDERIQFLLGNKIRSSPQVFDQYHFGGYAKHNDALIAFMNNFYKEFNVPSDFVYTAKLFYAIIDLIKKDHFPKGSKIACLHTGGLQGNDSLPAGMLNF